MTGTGTQIDPYIVDNETDFRNAVSQFGKYVKCVPNMIIDLNDRSPYADYFEFECQEIDGNGLIIQNGRFEYTIIRHYKDGGHYNNINVLDCYVGRKSDEAGAIYNYSYTNSFYNCTFRIQQNGGSLVYGSSAREHFYSCNIVIRKARLGYMQSPIVHCYDCNIFMYDSSTLCANLEFCYLTGKYSGINYCNMKNCILEPEEELANPLNNNTQVQSSACVYNKDLIKSWTGTSANFGKGLTTEEIRNRQKLYEAGILINPTEVSNE